jgi:hypothetical protein
MASLLCGLLLHLACNLCNKFLRYVPAATRYVRQRQSQSAASEPYSMASTTLRDMVID